MEIYNMIEEYLKYERMDVNSQTDFSAGDIKNKIDYLRKKIKEEVTKTEDTEKLKKILYTFKLALTPAEEFMIYNRFFSLTKKDKEVIESFIDILYFWGPDYDSEIEKINILLEKNEIEKASQICMNIKY